MGEKDRTPAASDVISWRQMPGQRSRGRGLPGEDDRSEGEPQRKERWTLGMTLCWVLSLDCRDPDQRLCCQVSQGSLVSHLCVCLLSCLLCSVMCLVAVWCVNCRVSLWGGSASGVAQQVVPVAAATGGGMSNILKEFLAGFSEVLAHCNLGGGPTGLVP